MSQWNGSVTLVSNFNSQLQLLIDYLNSNLDCAIAVGKPESSSLSAAGQHDLILLDADCMNLASMQAWHPDLDTSRHVILAAFNVQDELQAYELVTGLKLRGVFYRHDSLELFCKGIETLQTGHSWMSRSQMAQVVDAFHRQQRNTYQPVCGLTQREIQILGLLSAGATNKERFFADRHKAGAPIPALSRLSAVCTRKKEVFPCFIHRTSCFTQGVK